jgi:hypothetical protein
VNDKWPIRIIILDRGFVLVCRCPAPQEYALWLPYTDRRTIRRWGTTEGIAQLCDGPTGDTVLDQLCPAGQVPVRAILDVMEVDQSAWKQHLDSTDRARRGR